MLLAVIIIFTFAGCSMENEPVSFTQSSKSKDTLIVHYIDVGQADSILVQINGKNMLIDAGNKEDGNKVVSYLQKQNVSKLDYVIATHPHEDHIGGMSNIIKSFSMGDFYAPKKIATTKVFENMINALDSKKIKTASAGVKLDLGENVTCEMLAPNSKDYKDINNYSAVIRLIYGDSKFLFMGDAEKLSEEEILSTNNDISADILKVGHHGSSSSSSVEFLDKVSPKIVVISSGKGNEYGHPNKEVLDEFKKRDCTIYRTDIDGTIVFTSDGKKIKKE